MNTANLNSTARPQESLAARARFLRIIGLLIALPLPGCAAQVPSSVQEQFAKVAEQLRAFPPDHKFYVSPSTPGSAPAVDGTPMDLRMELANGWPVTPGTAEYQHLMHADYPVPFLLSLIGDPAPKVRTLAAAALVAKGDPRLQRHLGPLLDDQSQTFDVIATLPTDNYMPPHYVPQTVAAAVLRLVEKPSKGSFDTYWAIHGNREYCADWFLWQFHRPEFASLARQGILNVPSPERELITLWIGSGRSDFQNARFPGYSDAELLAAAKLLGRMNVLSVLRNQPPTTDPDILHSGGSGTEAQQHDYEMSLFLLSHAKDLLDASDADTLLDLEVAEKNRTNPQTFAYRERWPIAAASLRPKQADAILNAAETRWPDVPNIQLARWDDKGPASLPKILSWFYRSARTQQELALAIVRVDPNDDYKSLVAAILASDGRLQISGEAMYRFATLKRKWKADFDAQFVDWVFAQPPDPDLAIMGPPRQLVVQVSGVSQELVRDPRFGNADGQLLYVIEQCLIGDLKLRHAQSIRLDQLINQVYSQHPQTAPESTLQEIRTLLRSGVQGS